VRLVPIADIKGRRQPGALRGKLRVGPEFFEPLADEELARWEKLVSRNDVATVMEEVGRREKAPMYDVPD
jgi:hypothetical protein